MGSQTGKRVKGESWSELDSHEFASNVGERIRAARMQKGWTQVQLAEASGLSSNYVARLERGELGASLYVALRLADALGISLNGLAQPAPSSSARSTSRRRAG